MRTQQLAMILFFSAATVGLSLWGDERSTAIAASVSAQSSSQPLTINARNIRITATPRNLDKENVAKGIAFEVTLETHVHPLVDDLTKVSALIADGKRYAPLAWEGSAPGGHHRKGLLRFGGIAPQPAAVELQIHLTGDTAPRSFRWMLK